ncbi:MAG TPA: hypothetical protein VHG72_11145 [Polyangia bacterium]|nr:hypothetical protein [Polyangia bacterium]
MRTAWALALGLTAIGLVGCTSKDDPGGPDICGAGCLCGNPSESQCMAEMCARAYSRQPDGSLKYAYCTNGPENGIYVIDAGFITDASSQ